MRIKFIKWKPIFCIIFSLQINFNNKTKWTHLPLTHDSRDPTVYNFNKKILNESIYIFLLKIIHKISLQGSLHWFRECVGIEYATDNYLKLWCPSFQTYMYMIFENGEQGCELSTNNGFYKWTSFGVPSWWITRRSSIFTFFIQTNQNKFIDKEANLLKRTKSLLRVQALLSWCQPGVHTALMKPYMTSSSARASGVSASVTLACSWRFILSFIRSSSVIYE